MRGRKPKAGAQRRGGVNDRALSVPMSGAPVEADAYTTDGPAMPPSVSDHEHRVDMWRSLCGDGSAYRPEDAPLVSAFVVWSDVAEQIQSGMTNDDGGVALTVDGKPSPYLRQLDLATKNILKLADQLGCTPLARARLGLTEAATNNINVSIADRISRAVEREERRGKRK